jgi:hypothetical protein
MGSRVASKNLCRAEQLKNYLLGGTTIFQRLKQAQCQAQGSAGVYNSIKRVQAPAPPQDTSPKTS